MELVLVSCQFLNIFLYIDNNASAIGLLNAGQS